MYFEADLPPATAGGKTSPTASATPPGTERAAEQVAIHREILDRSIGEEV